MKCITCDQPLPENEDHPSYFLQLELRPKPDSLHEWHDSTQQLLKYIESLMRSLYASHDIDDDVKRRS